MAVDPGSRSGVRTGVIAVAALAAVFLVGGLATELWVDILWHGALDILPIFWTQALWGWGTRLAAALFVGVVVFLNLRVVSGTLRGIQIRQRLGNLVISQELPRRYVLLGMLGVSGLLALWVGAAVSNQSGVDLLLALRSGSWGVTDPVLGRDVSFYVFLLPLLQGAVALGLVTAFLVFASCVAGYVATGALQWGEDGLSLGDRPRKHLGLVFASFFLLLALQFWLSRYGLLQFGNSEVQGIFGFADAQARLPAMQFLTVLSVVGAGLVLFGAWRNRLGWVGGGIALVALGGLVVGQLYPSLVQRFRVAPNELARETPYIAHNIDFTRMGFGLDVLERASFDYSPPGDGPSATPVDWSAALEQFDGLPVWTENTLLATYRELLARFRYYNFETVAMDRYPVPTDDGIRLEPVAISVREIEEGEIPDPNWQNLHLRERFIQGYGVVASAAADRTGEGRPPLYVSALPPAPGEEAPEVPDPDAPPTTALDAAGGTPASLTLDQPAIYVGTSSQPYAIVTPSGSAFLAADGTPGEAGVDFPQGIQLGSLFRELAVAWVFEDADILFAQEVTEESRLVFRRSLSERVGRIAPFFEYSDPYPVVHEGRVVWILEGYTATRGFPLSRPVELRFRRAVNYMRNSLKVTVDAVSGEVNFYALPGDDPLLDAYRAAFPDLVQPFEDMPEGLRTHLRYSKTLLDVQAEVLLQYHQNTAPQFHGQQDVWETPRELSQTTNAVPFRPEYGIFRLPGDDAEDFHLTTGFVPAGRQNLTAVLSGRLAPDGRPQLRLFDVPLEEQVPGPRQVEALVEQDPEISQQFSLWRTGGSQVWTGHLHLVPVGPHILYMEPVFLAAEADAIPQLRGFVVSDGNRVSMEPSLRGAVQAISGAALGPETDEVAGPGDAAADPGAPVAGVPAGEWPAEALQLLDQAEQRLRDGDYQGFGEALAELRELLQTLRGGAGS